jgi:8-oxo-dGTP diphosphatase
MRQVDAIHVGSDLLVRLIFLSLPKENNACFRRWKRNNNVPKKEIHVVCLIVIDQRGFFYATQRPPEKTLGLHWEFPGGKVEADELPEMALRREIQEELSVSIGQLEALPVVAHSYDFAIIRLTPFLHKCTDRPNFSLTEHVDSRWMHASDWSDYTWAPADIPVIEYLLNEIAGHG